MAKIETVFQSITTGGDSPQPKFTWPYWVTTNEKGEKVCEGNQRWIKVSDTQADGIEGNKNKGITFAADCKVAGFGPDDALSQEETRAAMGIRPPVLETCSASPPHRYYKEEGSNTPCPFCESHLRELAEKKALSLESDLSQMKSILSLTQDKLAKAEEAAEELDKSESEVETQNDKPEEAPEPEKKAPAKKKTAKKKAVAA